MAIELVRKTRQPSPENIICDPKHLIKSTSFMKYRFKLGQKLVVVLRLVLFTFTTHGVTETIAAAKTNAHNTKYAAFLKLSSKNV